MIKRDDSLLNLLKITALPSTDAIGDWLRRTGAGEGLNGLSQVNERIVATRIRQMDVTEHTLDGDASQIVAEKKAASFTV